MFRISEFKEALEYTTIDLLDLISKNEKRAKTIIMNVLKESAENERNAFISLCSYINEYYKGHPR